VSSRDGKKPESVLAEYLDELLSVSDEGSPWLEEDAPHGKGDGPVQGGAPSASEFRRQRAGARRPQAASTRVAEKAPASSLVSPAFREIPPEAPGDSAPDGAPSQVPEEAPEKAPSEPGDALRTDHTAEDEAGPAVTEPVPAEQEVPEVPEEPASEPVVAETLSEPESVPEAEPWQQGRPPWAQEGFECLIFRVAGLQLAVPLVLLGQIHRLDPELTPLVGRPDWFMGLLRVGDQNVRVTDTALWVMPDRYRREFRDGYRFVIQLGDSAWGLACDEVAQSFHVQPDEVKWRSQGGRRQWLAGTIKKEMCALLDVSRLAEQLHKAENERRPDLDR